MVAKLAPRDLMDRLVIAPPEGLRFEPVFADGESMWIRIVELPEARED